jgi:DNA-directed RNA polymerase subunit RPC12/RpoP
MYHRGAFAIHGNTCQRCGSDAHILVHHVDGNHLNNPDDGSNWEILCKSCHQSHHRLLKPRPAWSKYTSEEDRHAARIAQRRKNYYDNLDHSRERARRHAAAKQARLFLPENAEARAKYLQSRKERNARTRRRQP